MATDNLNTKANIKGYFNTGDKPTEDQFQEWINSMVSMGTDTVVEITQAGGTYNLAVDGSGNGPGVTYVYTGAGDLTINLPSVSASNLGIWYNIVNVGRYVLTLQAADEDKIEDSGPGGTFYTGEGAGQSSSSSSSETLSTSSESGGTGVHDDYASCKIQLCLSDWWHVLHGRKTWTSTQFV